jgi:hypothetical protein
MEQLATLASTYKELVYANYWMVAYVGGALTLAAYVVAFIRHPSLRQSDADRATAAVLPFLVGGFWPVLLPYGAILLVIGGVVRSIHFLMNFRIAQLTNRVKSVKAAAVRQKEESTKRVVAKKKQVELAVVRRVTGDEDFIPLSKPDEKRALDV